MSDPDRPLTNAQEVALIALAEYAERVDPTGWSRPCRDVRTLEALRTAGLAEMQIRPMTEVARITPAGLALLRSMGD